MAEREASMSIEELETAALKLTPAERELLAVRLLSSVESRLEFEAEWVEEIKRRTRELDEGTVETIPAEQVIREALDRLK
jgi:putative addiction module component (TIGR02574 family)